MSDVYSFTSFDKAEWTESDYENRRAQEYVILLMLGARVCPMNALNTQKVSLRHFESEIFALCGCYPSFQNLIQFDNYPEIKDDNSAPHSQIITDCILNPMFLGKKPFCLECWIYEQHTESEKNNDPLNGHIHMTPAGYAEYQSYYDTLVAHPEKHALLIAVNKVSREYSDMNDRALTLRVREDYFSARKKRVMDLD